jgi:hypothetical protein
VRIAIVANSQGTALGVERGLHYPALLRDALEGDYEVDLFVVSGFTIRDFNDHIGSVVDARPDLVVVQVGIVEAAKRILSTREKTVLRVFGRLGGKLTKFLHDRRSSVIRARHRLRLDTRLLSPREFDEELERYVAALRNGGADVLLLEIPAFGAEHERRYYPLISEDIDAFNAVLRRHGAVPMLPPESDVDAIWQPGTVHFTADGHRIAADHLATLLREKTAAAV